MADKKPKGYFHKWLLQKRKEANAKDDKYLEELRAANALEGDAKELYHLQKANKRFDAFYYLDIALMLFFVFQCFSVWLFPSVERIDTIYTVVAIVILELVMLVAVGLFALFRATVHSDMREFIIQNIFATLFALFLPAVVLYIFAVLSDIGSYSYIIIVYIIMAINRARKMLFVGYMDNDHGDEALIKFLLLTLSLIPALLIIALFEIVSFIVVGTEFNGAFLQDIESGDDVLMLTFVPLVGGVYYLILSFFGIADVANTKKGLKAARVKLNIAQIKEL
ncbi:MAG: hypothetical protein LBS73_03655 [Campylobacteraceae bacterium]|jgi:hypothetical protein|nr:hypothetical protein [Campylobacteraceae bacterium]